VARSLTVKHEEQLKSSPLLNAFLLLAVGWMVVGAVLANMADAAPLAESAPAAN
jgi:hypothetical protein